MPLYEYECLKCGGRFETIQRFSDEPLKEHPECGGEVRKLLSAPAIQFKGSGWYVTDYARSDRKERKSEEKATKSEDKPAAKGSGDSDTRSTKTAGTTASDSPKNSSKK